MTRFAKVRITCRTPESTAHGHHTDGSKYPLVNGCLASAHDARVFVVTDDCVEHDLLVDFIEFAVRCDNEPARATIRLLPDQVDVEALAAITWEVPK